MTIPIRVATINILQDSSRWVERRAILSQGLAAVAPDLIALQEVTNPLGWGSAHWLADELGGYSVHACPKLGWGGRREGIAILSRLPVVAHATLDLGSQGRVAQFVHVSAGGHTVVLVNGHYFFPVGAHEAQVKQVTRVLDRLRSLEPGTSVIVCGDFNATPTSRAVALIRQSMTSAHLDRHGREPDFTCPTPLINGGRIRRAVTYGLLKLCSIQPSSLWRATLDYIFVSPDVRVVDCELVLNHPAPNDPTLYASDHFGLAATLEIGVGGPSLMSR